MADNNQQEDKKTVVAFIVGLLIGGLLVWAFSGPAVDAPTASTASTTTEKAADKKDDTNSSATATKDDTDDTAQSSVAVTAGEGSVVVGDAKAGLTVSLTSANFPVSEGWIGVREYQNERLGSLLGVVRFSESQGLMPTTITLQYPTRAGAPYAVVMYSENGDRQFNLANDVQLDKVFATFTAK